MQNGPENMLNKYRKEYEKAVMSNDAYLKMKKRMEEGRKEKQIMKKKKIYISLISAAAAILILIILPNTSEKAAMAMGNIPVLGKFFRVVTIRDYQYNDDRHVADVKVPEITVESDTDSTLTEKAKDTTEKINEEIQTLTDKWIDEFKSTLDEEGYHDMLIKSEVINTTEDYFTLELICFQAAGSGYEEHHYYTIDLHTGERVKLSDLFKEDSDYITAISENIKEQMREQMKNDPGVMYWLDNEEYPEWNFKEISEDSSFYINADGNIVICFNEAEVAPASMGNVEFIIPDEVVADLLK